MSTKSLDDRRQALEESFFKKENEHLLAELREKKEHAEQRAALAEAMVIQDDTLLELMLETGLRAETWLVISLVPLVEVAWADREMASAERDAILQAAKEDGIADGSRARQLLDHWLEHRPAPALRDAWKTYVADVQIGLGDAARQALKEETLERAVTVAKAAGGILGLVGGVSDAEEDVLEDLRKAF